ncbi:Intraflagellar transport protein 80, partial [Gonapodya sp. JEL0774]
TASWRHLEAKQTEPAKILVKDDIAGVDELIELPVTMALMTLQHSLLLVVTRAESGSPAQRCYLYSEGAWNTPVVVELPTMLTVRSAVVGRDSFALIAANGAVHCFTRDGRQLSVVRIPQTAGGGQGENPDHQGVAIAGGIVAIRGAGGKATSSSTPPHQLILAILDSNRSLYMHILSGPSRGRSAKVAASIDHVKWNEDTQAAGELAAVGGGKVIVWWCGEEAVAGVSRGLASGGEGARWEKEIRELGRDIRIEWYCGSQIALRKADGGITMIGNLSPYPALLHGLVVKRQWEEAVRVCRYVKDLSLWCLLATHSLLPTAHLDTAEVALAALEDVPRVRHVNFAKSLPEGSEARRGEVEMLRGRVDDAVEIFSNAGCIARGVRAWVEAYRWDSALDLALKHSSHVEFVLLQRKHYLAATGRKENSKRFLELAEKYQGFDPLIVKSKQAEAESKEQRSGRTSVVK